MKKILSLALSLVLALMLCGAALADGIDWTSMTDDEIIAQIAAAQAELERRGGTPAAEEAYSLLEKGSKGDAVRALQKRLIELNYLSDAADGAYGNKTADAVELFQNTAGLPATGTADPKTQAALFSSDAPKAKVYQALDYTAISRDPDSYVGNFYKFSGMVLQVLEDDKRDGSTDVTLRISSKGNYDNVVYVQYNRAAGESRVLEDDKVTVYGTFLGLYTYPTVLGSKVTLPHILADSLTVK